MNATPQTETDIGVTLSAIYTMGGVEIQPPAPGVTVVVGANNSGKSTFLREVYELSRLQGDNQIKRLLVSGIRIDKKGTQEDLLSKLTRYIEGDMIQIGGNNVRLRQLLQDWRNLQTPGSPDVLAGLGELTPILLYYVNATSRGQGITAQTRRVDITRPPQNIMHSLEDDSQLMQRVSEISVRIFRRPLTLDPLGSQVQLRIGTPNVPAPPINAVTREYIEAVNALEPLQLQGDGMTAQWPCL